MKNRIKKSAMKIIALVLCLSALFATSAFAVSAAFFFKNDEEEQPVKDSITISAPLNTVNKGKTLQLVADKDNVKWSTSDEKIATVDNEGLVKGISKGTAIITATDGDISGSIKINVVKRSNLVSDFLTKHNVLSYKYSYRDDYYYVDSPNAWQRHFGFNKMYDFIAPYILLEYDYARVHFEYEGKDWMIQLWKGQYGMVFYGGEVGIYLKDHSDKKDNAFTTYKCADKDNWLTMQTNLYHDKKLKGDYVHEFSTPTEKTWWSTGFKPGHLLKEEPAKELRLTGTITLKDEEMTKAFSDGLKECGFKQVEKTDDLQIDSFYVDGCDVVYSWQDLSYAENTVPIKIAGSVLLFFNIAGILAFIFGVLSLFSMAGLAFIIIL